MVDRLSLVIGASGLVGRCLMRHLRERGSPAAGTYASRAAAGLRRLDITDAEQVAAVLSELRPTHIYLAAALTHVDYCEEHPELARRINVVGPRIVAAEARRQGAAVAFYSSEYVFDGAAGPYDEEAPTLPLSVYGRTKLEAEKAVREILPEALILRTTVVFGWDPQSKNFAMQIGERVENGQDITVPGDQFGSPTWAEFLADASVRLLERGVGGVVNVAGRDTVARADFARALVRVFGGAPEKVIAVSTAALKQKAPRPLRCGLRTEKLQALLGEPPISMEEALALLKARWQSDARRK